MDFGLQPGEGGDIGMDPGGNNAINAADPWDASTYQDNYFYGGNDDFDLASMYDYGSPSTGVYGNASSPNTTPFAQGLANVNDFFNKNAFGRIAGMALNFTPAGKAFNVGRAALTSLGSGNVMGAIAPVVGALGGAPGAMVNAGYQASRGNYGPGAGLATGMMTGNPALAFGASQLANQFNGRTPGINPTASNETGFNVEGLAGGLANLYAASRANDGMSGASGANEAVQGQISSLSNMYGPNSPYAQQLRQQLERKDAASGRRSQYGPREVQLQAALADKAAGVGDTIGRLASSNQANQLALSKQKNQTRAQQLALLMNMGRSSGAFGALNNMFRSPVAAGSDMADYNIDYTGPV
jgi:hypothetical protein